MKKLNNLRRSLYIDILITVLIVIISIPLWLSFDLEAYAIEASGYANMNYVKYEIINKADGQLQSFSDEEALLFCETNDILIYNDSNTLDDYSLVLKLDKEKDVNIDNIRINVNYDIKYLNDYYFYEDDTSYYYLLDSDDLVANSQKYVISLWHEEASVDKSINYDFVLI